MPSILEILAAKKAAAQAPIETNIDTNVSIDVNIDDIDKQMQAIEGKVKEENKNLTPLQARIRHLVDLPDENIKEEMDSLRAILLENPAACELMLPEDIGCMVAAVRRISSVAIAQAEKKKKPSKSSTGKTKVSSKDLLAMVAEINLDDL